MDRLLAIVCVLLFATPACASDLSAASNEELIDSLTHLSTQTPDIDEFATFGGFMADNKPFRFEVGLLGAPPPTVPPAMRELVRRGVSVIPDLLLHLNDARPTGIVIDGGDFGGKPNDHPGKFFFMAKVFSGEYDARQRTKPYWIQCDGDCFEDYKGFSGDYIVKVGDVCFGLVGQIVDRELVPVRYQPTAILIVNSPIEVPALAAKTRKDWRGLTDEQLKASLLTDIHDADVADQAASAFERLRFYFPNSYAALNGRDAELRAKFETEEKSGER